MIFGDRVSVVCNQRSGGEVVERFNGTVPAIVVPLPGGQFQLLLKPFGYLIPPNVVSMVPAVEGASQLLLAWGEYTHLSLDGPMVRHRLRGRLHHYEAVVRAP